MTPIRKILGKNIYQLIWAGMDDVTETVMPLSYLYDGVPDSLKNKKVHILELYKFREEDRDEILKWLETNEKEE